LRLAWLAWFIFVSVAFRYPVIVMYQNDTPMSSTTG
jgi:hypothetical protein